MKKLPLLKLCMVSSTAISINIGYAIIAAYGLPLILATGLNIKYATQIFSISSILSFLLQGILGTASDLCTCVWGRRRPFIVTFSLLTVGGFILASYSFYLSVVIDSTVLISVCVYIGMTLCSFSVGVLQLPSRAYLLDVISNSQVEIANFIYSALFGVGTIIGTLLGAMKWSLLTHQPVTIPHQAQIVYTIASIIIIMCTIVTICSVKEKRYNSKLDDNHSMQHHEEELEMKGDTHKIEGGNQDNDEVFEDNFEHYNDDNMNDFNEVNDDDNTQLIKQEITKQQAHHSKGTFRNCMRKAINPFVDIFIFLPKMSYHMWLLWVMVFFSLQGLTLFMSYVTLYVGTVVYDGDPHSNQSSDSYQRYVTGIHTGAWSLFLAAITTTISSLTLNFIVKHLVSLKTIYLSSTALYCVGSCFLIYFHELFLVFAVGAIFGVYFGLTLTVPYILIPIYKVMM